MITVHEEVEGDTIALCFPESALFYVCNNQFYLTTFVDTDRRDLHKPVSWGFSMYLTSKMDFQD